MGVTSRRTSSWHERQKIMQKRKEQERFAKLLASKWAEEDRKPKDKKKRRREEREESDKGEHEEEQHESTIEPKEEKPQIVGGWSTVEQPQAIMAERELRDVSTVSQKTAGATAPKKA